MDVKKQENEKLTEESFVKTKNGSLDFGEIPLEIANVIGRQSAKIRLRYGNEKQGLVHIEHRHKADMRALEFDDVLDFISEVTQNFTAIYKNTGENSRSLVLVDKTGKLKIVSVQLEPSAEGDFYEVKNATPGRQEQFKNKAPLWERAGPSTSSE